MIRFAFGKKKMLYLASGNWLGMEEKCVGIWPGGMGELGRNRCKSYFKGSPTAFEILGFSGPLEQAFICDVQLPYILFIFHIER